MSCIDTHDIMKVRLPEMLCNLTGVFLNIHSIPLLSPDKVPGLDIMVSVAMTVHAVQGLYQVLKYES